MKDTLSLHPLIPFFLGTVSLLFFLSSGPVQAQDEPAVGFILSSPVVDQVEISKKPKIEWESVSPLGQESPLVLLDGMDVSGLVEQQDGRFSFSPIMVLPAGEHNLYISAIDGTGNLIEQEFFFSTRHSESFEEAYSHNELSLIYRGALNHHIKSKTASEDVDSEWIIDEASFQPLEDEVDDFSHGSIDAYLSSDSVIRDGNWSTSFITNMRYFDQRADIMDPEKRGVSLIDILLASSYTGEKLNVEIGLGDNAIQESRNTVDNLYRRGLKAVARYEDLTLSGFGVLADEQYNELDHLGLRFDSNDHLMGISGQYDFFDKQMFLKAIYVNGGETGNSLGTWSEGGARKGDAFGFVFFTDFLSGQLTTEIEYDESTISKNTSAFDSYTVFDDLFDEVESTVADEEMEKSDKAYRINIAGLKNVYNYELSYEYTGPQYEVVGNQSLVGDRAGYSFYGGAAFEYHGVNLFGTSFWDDVDNNPLYQRITSTGGGIEYSYMGWLRFPVSLRYERGSQRSKDEPEDVDETAVDIDTIEGRVGYQDGPWMGEIATSFSRQNDKAPQDLDNELITVFLSPGYSGDFLTVFPSWSYNSTADLQSSVRTDTHTWTLDVQSLVFEERLLCELGGTYDRTTSDDDTMDSKNFQGYARATYRFQTLWNLVLPSVALEYTRTYQKDDIADSMFQEDVMTVVLSSTLPYSF